MRERNEVTVNKIWSNFQNFVFFFFLVKERIKTNQLKKEKENLEIMRDAA